MSTTVNPTTAPSPDIDAAEQSPDDRRHRTRLRELCDEVLASYRAASGNEPLTADERREARSTLDLIAPRAGRRERSR
jgi:hypothetical protein